MTKQTKLETGTGFKYTYNEMGQRTKTTPTTGPATSYGYDQAGNLISIERPKEGSTEAITDAYGYNGSGLRVSQTISGTTTYLAWNIAETIPQLLSDGTNSYIYGPNNLPIEQINGEGKVLYLHHDQQGSTRMLTGSTGAKEATMTYDAYGNTTGTTGTAKTPLGYDGQYTSSDTGLVYLRNRVYDPGTAQFLTVDPLVQWTHAPYTYANDNPLNSSDPTGLFPWESIAEGLGVGASCLLGPEVCVPVGLGVLDAHVIAADISSAETGCSPWPEIVPALVGAGVGALPFAGGVVAKHVWEASEWAYRLGVGAGLTAGGLAGTAASSSASPGGGSHGGSSSCGCSTG